MPRRRSWRSTMRSRSVDVVPESRRVMNRHLPTPQSDDPGALERREEAAAALAQVVPDLSMVRVLVQCLLWYRFLFAGVMFLLMVKLLFILSINSIFFF